MTRFQQLTLRTILAASAIAGLASAASAHEGRHDDRRRPVADHVDARQDRQMHLIRHGAATGRLTPHETRQLMRQQAQIRHAEAQARADGHVSRRERERLAVLQDQARRNISRQLQDRQTL